MESGHLALADRRLAWRAWGGGRPAVLIEPGLGVDDSHWDEVRRRLAGIARVVRYDRAGRGDSSAATRPRRLADLLGDLHALLRAPGVGEGRWILAGHSFGALLVRLYAVAHPEAVAGLALVDAMHQDQFDLLGPLFPCEGEAPGLGAMREFWQGGWRDWRRNDEGIDLAEVLTQARGAPALGALPLCVVSAGPFLGPRFGAAAGERLQAAWGELQNRTAGLSTDVEQVVVESARHDVPGQVPEVVASAIERLWRRCRG